MSLPSQPDLQAAIAVTRFGLGARPGELQAARSDPKGWLAAQIRPEGADAPPAPPSGPLPDSRTTLVGFQAYVQDRRQVKRARAAADPSAAPAAGAPAPDPAAGAAAPDPAMSAAPAPASAVANDADVQRLIAQRQMEAQPLRQEVAAEMLARTQLAATTPAGFRERWALFWGNHFTVSAAKFKVAVVAGPFEREAIRPHVFGRFEDLLVASTTHPGMLLYLDQESSIGPDSPAGERRRAGLNENLGREVMELHTVGADAGYTQADVTEFARALTGYSVGAPRDGAMQGRFLFRERVHEPGVRTVMGRRYAQEGPAQARAVLTDLAAHPQTARRLSHKLAVHFVADDPPPALVARLADRWTRSGGDLAVVAHALIESPEAWAPDARKFKTPNEFLVSSYRALGVVPQTAQEIVGPLTQLGQRPFSSPQPNGWSEEATDWASGAAMVKRLGWSKGLADAHAPADPPVQVADAALGARAGPALRTALARAETRSEAATILLMSPEFQRR